MDNRRQPHIVHLDANLKGKDYVVADIHGNLACLQLALAKLTDNDRLIINGDVVDRGPHSIECIEHILDYQAKHPDRLYVSYGNHEIDCLEAFLEFPLFAEDLLNIKSTDALNEWLANLRGNPAYHACRDAMESVAFLKDSGGEWLLHLFHQHLLNGLVKITPDKKLSVISNCQLEKAAYFLLNLPYAYRVNDARPYICVHADMPDTDATLLNTTHLSEAQKHYYTHARQPIPGRNKTTYFLDPHPRTATDSIVYVGHDVTLHMKIPAVRYHTNTVNQDCRAYHCNVLMMVNHTDATVELLSPEPLEENKYSHTLRLLQQTVQAHLHREKLRYDTINHDHHTNTSLPRKRATMLLFTPQEATQPKTIKLNHELTQAAPSPTFFL